MAISSERWIIQAKHKDERTVLSWKWRKVNSTGEYPTLESAIEELSNAWNHSQWHIQIFNLDTHEIVPYEIL